MSAHVLLNLLNELRQKKRKRENAMLVLRAFYRCFAASLDYFIIMLLTLYNRVFCLFFFLEGGGVKTAVLLRSNYKML